MITRTDNYVMKPGEHNGRNVDKDNSPYLNKDNSFPLKFEIVMQTLNAMCTAGNEKDLNAVLTFPFNSNRKSRSLGNCKNNANWKSI